MNNENTKLVQNLIDEAKAFESDSNWGQARISYLRALDEIAAIKEIDPEALEVPLLTEQTQTIEKMLVEVNHELAIKCMQKGLTAIERKVWATAIDELEEATRLAKESDEAFLLEIKENLDKARKGHIDSIAYKKLTPFVQRGDDFRKSENHAEAILEYTQALKLASGLSEEHRFVVYIKNALAEAKRNLIRPYLARALKARMDCKYRQASNLIKRARLILGNDAIYDAFMMQLQEEIDGKIPQDHVVEEDDFEQSEHWEQAVKDYEEALDLYSSFTVVDPFSPAYTGVNIYEDRFADARKNLGKLYKQRGDKLRDTGKVERAIKNYKESLKLLSKSDKMFHDAFSELKKLRVQIPTK